MLRLTFLGTGTSQGTPMIGCNCSVCRSEDPHDRRLRSSVMLERFDTAGSERRETLPETPAYAMYKGPIGADARIVIDAGPDFRFQMLRHNVKTLDAILLTHEHRDHVAGIDDVRAFNFFEGKPMPVFATGQVCEAVKKDFDYAFPPDPYPGAPKLELNVIDPEKEFWVAGFRVVPVSGFHATLPVTGFRIGPLAYLTDFSSIADEQLIKLKGIKLLVVNALRFEKHPSHFTVEDALALSSRLGNPQTLLTHMSHQLGTAKSLAKRLPEHVQPAFDGLQIDLS